MKKVIGLVLIMILIGGFSYAKLFAKEEQTPEVPSSDKDLLKGRVPKWISVDKNENGVVDKGDELLWPALTIGRAQAVPESSKKVSMVYVVTKCIKGSVRNKEPDTIIYYRDPYAHSYEPAVIGLLEYDKSTRRYYIEVSGIHRGDEGETGNIGMEPPKDTEKRMGVAWSPQLRKEADKYVGSQVVLIGKIINDRKLGLIFGIDIIL